MCVCVLPFCLFSTACAILVRLETPLSGLLPSGVLIPVMFSNSSKLVNDLPEFSTPIVVNVSVSVCRSV